MNTNNNIMVVDKARFKQMSLTHANPTAFGVMAFLDCLIIVDHSSGFFKAHKDRKHGHTMDLPLYLLDAYLEERRK